jgi:hypothetical protein
MTTRISKTVAGLLAAATLATSMTVFTTQAEARHFGWGWGGVGLGIAAGAMLGAAAASAYDGPYYRCRPVDMYDRFGNYIRTVRRCW